MIQISSTTIKDCVVLTPDIHKDERGVFAEMYKRCAFPEFVPFQSNYSKSSIGTIRGIHQTPYAKLVTCVSGKVYDVCVDLRPESETYRQYCGVNLTSDNLQSLYIPPNCGHAFFATTDCVLYYQQDSVYDSEHDYGFCWCEPAFNIIWPVKAPTVISTRDKNSCKEVIKKDC